MITIPKAENDGMSYRLHGTVLPGAERSTVYVRGGRFTHERPAGPVTTLAENAWLTLSSLVSAVGRFAPATG
jgi:hypothetical protein